MHRYRKQTLFAPIGERGQALLGRATALLVGCGATGSVIAETLVRAGLGTLRVADRDFVEASNLQRQVLFDEADAAARTPKAAAAAKKLAAVNSAVRVEPHVADVTPATLPGLADGCDLLLDGTDNFETRFLVNDLSLETGVPWVYAGVVGGAGQTTAVLPGETACLRCLMPEPPAPGTAETCDTAGVIGPAVGVVASLAAASALKLLTGNRDAVRPHLVLADVWAGTFRTVDTTPLFAAGDCPACGRGGPRERLWLRGERAAGTAVLCGRNAVQLTPAGDHAANPAGGGTVDLDALADRFRRASGDGAEVRGNRFLVSSAVPLAGPDGREVRGELTVFRDGRVIVTGTTDPAVARAAVARWLP